MTMAPETSEATGDRPGSVRLVSDLVARWLIGRGLRVRVLSSYVVPVEPAPDRHAAGSPTRELHSLAETVDFVCAGCLQSCVATLVAIRRRCLVCPACFSCPTFATDGIEDSEDVDGMRPHRVSGRHASPVRAGWRRPAPWAVHAVRPCRAERASALGE